MSVSIRPLHEFAETCVFSKQSLEPGHCSPVQLISAKLFTYLGHPFSRSYGASLSSSLIEVIPYALGFSPYLPVLVWSTDCYQSRTEVFLDSMGSISSPILGQTPHCLSMLKKILRPSGFAKKDHLQTWTWTTNAMLTYPSVLPHS